MNRNDRQAAIAILLLTLCALSSAVWAHPLISRSAAANSYLESGADWAVKSEWKWAPAGSDNAHAQTEAKNEKLLNAIRDADVKAVKAAVSGGADVNIGDDDGVTALMYAAIYADESCVKLLLAKGANPNAKTKGAITALMLSVSDARKVRLLLSKGAEVNAKSNQGHTALSIATGREGSVEVVKLLLDHGADLGLGNPLAAASRSGDVHVVKLLLEKGVDVNNSGNTGGPPPRSAKRAADLNKARETTSVSPLLGLAGNIGGTPLMYAVLARNTEIIELLLARGADVNARNNDLGSGTALILAAQIGDAGAVRRLLEKGAEVNARHESGYTALMYAAASESNDPEMVKALLARGAEINASARDGETALTLAGRKGKTVIVRILEQAVKE